MKLFFYDLETTGTTERHAVHQLSGRIIIDGIVKENFDFRIAPHYGAEIDEEALAVGGVTLEQIQAYPDMAYVFPQLMGMLDRYVDKYDKRDKFYLVGYNNSHFDNRMFRAFFSRNGFKYFGSYFWSNSFDCMVLATPHLCDRRTSMLDFKQKSVAKALGIPVDERRLHDATYDIELCHQIYDKVCGKY